VAELPRYAAGDACPAGDAAQCVPGMIKENATDTSNPITIRLATGLFETALPAGGIEAVPPQSLQVPSSIPLTAGGTGTYYAYLYIDDQRVVSELNEDDNIVQGGPITVRQGGYGTLGLQSPCSATSCDKTGTLPLAWQFTRGSLPVESASVQPQVRFYGGCAPNPVGPLVKTSFPNPADITSGNSGWQYFPTSGGSRPQYTWQLNFDSTGLPRGTCYTMWIEVLSSGQVVGSTDPARQPLGPFAITPR
jgi:hypothetical protein